MNCVRMAFCSFGLHWRRMVDGGVTSNELNMVVLGEPNVSNE